MYNVSDKFKKAQMQPLKEIITYIAIDGKKIDEHNLIEVDLSSISELLKSNMTKAEIKMLGEHSFLNKEIEIYSGVILEDGTSEYINYGAFKVIEEEIEKDKGTTKLICYDKMLNAMKPYVPPNIEYPIDLYNYTIHILNDINLELKNLTLTNGDLIIEQELYAEIKGITYRDILEEIAEATGTLCLINNNKIEFKDILETNEVLNYDNMFNLKIEEQYGAINSLILSREPQEDNVYKRLPEAIDIKEIKIADNQLLDQNRTLYIEPLFNKLKGLEYYIGEITTEGLGWYEVGDKLNVIDEDNNIVPMLLSSVKLNFDGGITEELSSVKLRETKTEYKYATKEEKAIKNASLKVDKQEMQIEALVTNINKQSEKISKITQTADDINVTLTNAVENIQTQITDLNVSSKEMLLAFKRQNGNNLIKNSVMKNGTKYWFKEIINMYTSNDQPFNPADNQLWFNVSDSDIFKKNTMYRWDASKKEWVISDITKEELAETGVDGFIQYENEESRQNTISNSIILMNAGKVGEKTHLFGITESVAINNDMEYISLGLKVKNQIKTGNIYLVLGFSPIELPNIGFQQETLHSIYEKWFKITPDDFTNWERIEKQIKVPKRNDLKKGYKGDTEPTDKDIYWLDTTTSIYPKAKKYNREKNAWEISEDDYSLDINGDVYVYRTFYDGYYKTMHKAEDFKANYFSVILTCYPSFNYSSGKTLPVIGKKDEYFGISGSTNSEEDTVYRAKYENDKFTGWENTHIPSILITPTLPSPPFPNTSGIPISGEFYFSDLKAESGIVSTPWSPHPDEVYARNYKADETGIEIKTSDNDMFLNESEITSKYKNEVMFKLTKEVSLLKNLMTDKALIAGLNIQRAKMGSKDVIILF